MPIRLKLLIGFLVVTTMAGFLGAFGVYSVAAMGELAIETYDRPLMAINHARAAETDFNRIKARISPLASKARSAPLASSVVTAPNSAELEELFESFRDNLDIAIERALSAESRAAGEAVLERAGGWQEMSLAILSGRGSDAVVHKAATDAIETGLGEMVETMAAEGFDFRFTAQALVERQAWIMFGAVLVTVILAIGLALLIAKWIVTPLKRVIEVFDALSKGDIAVELEVADRGEVGQLARRHKQGQVTVNIGGSGRAILVLTAYEPVKWTVRPRGVFIDQILLFGYYDQEVVAPPGSKVFSNLQTAAGSSRVYAYKKDRNYNQLQAMVREITGKEIDTFQGKYRAGSFQVNSSGAAASAPGDVPGVHKWVDDDGVVHYGDGPARTRSETAP